MSLFSTQPRIEGGQYGYHPHYRKDYGFLANVRKYFRRLFRDLDRCTHIKQSPEERRSHHEGQITLATYARFLEKMDDVPARGERKRHLRAAAQEETR